MKTACQREPTVYTNIRTRFRWVADGLLLPETPCNFIAHFHSETAYYPKHDGWLSIKSASNGQELYNIDRQRLAVDDASYLILNEGQSYASEIDAGTPVESFAVFFDPSFAADVLRSLVTSSDQLLDVPQDFSQPVTFFQQLYGEDDCITPVLTRLRQEIADGTVSQGWLEEQFHLLLERLIRKHRQIGCEIEEMTSFRHSIRVELYRRLHLAQDYMVTNLHNPLTLPEIATVSCFSPHHFLRTFKQAFHETPHQFLVRKRLERARRLLALTDRSVSEICFMVGFESLGSFSALFSRRTGMPPTVFRKLHAAN
jgi:AraC family transcriptional regulator